MGVPALPKMLGAAGVLPQLAACAAVYFGPTEWRDPAMVSGLLYAAIIFTFLGGMWWGMAAAAPAAEGRGTLGWVWVAAVAPSLIAFAALLGVQFGAEGLGIGDTDQWQTAALMSLGGGIILSPLVDTQLARDANGGGLRIAPPWWMRLRWPLSLALGGATIALAVN